MWTSFSPIHLVDIGRADLFNRLAFDLHGRCQLARLDRKLARKDPESLDALELGQLAVERLDDFPVERNDVLAADEDGPFSRRTAQVVQAALQGGEIGDDERGNEPAAI